MKRMFLVIACVALLVGCVGLPPPQKAVPEPQQVVLTVKSATDANVSIDDKDKVQKSMEVPNEELVLSSTCRILGDTAYTTSTNTFWGSDDLWKDFQILKARGIKKVIMYMNNGGGFVHEGMAVADEILMAESFLDITIEARGIVASAAIPIFLSANHRIASKHTTFMTHPIALYKGGFGFEKEELKDLKSQAKMVEMSNSHYAEIVSSHSKLTMPEALGLMEKTTWMTAEDAQKIGFVDEIR